MDTISHLRQAMEAMEIQTTEVASLKEKIRILESDNKAVRDELVETINKLKFTEAEVLRFRSVTAADIGIAAMQGVKDICQKVFENLPNLSQMAVENLVKVQQQERSEDERKQELEKSITPVTTSENSSGPVPTDFAPPKYRTAPVTTIINGEDVNIVKPPPQCNYQEAAMFWDRHCLVNRPGDIDALRHGFHRDYLRDDSPLKKVFGMPRFLKRESGVSRAVLGLFLGG